MRALCCRRFPFFTTKQIIIQLLSQVNIRKAYRYPTVAAVAAEGVAAVAGSAAAGSSVAVAECYAAALVTADPSLVVAAVAALARSS